MPARLAARVRVYSRGHGRKTDKDDAVSVGLAALDGAGIRPVTPDGDLVSLRLLCDRREELGAQRTQAVCRLHRLLAELTPGGMRRELSANKAQALLAHIDAGAGDCTARSSGAGRGCPPGRCTPSRGCRQRAGRRHLYGRTTGSVIRAGNTVRSTVPSRNEQVVGSIPTGGSRSKGMITTPSQGAWTGLPGSS